MELEKTTIMSAVICVSGLLAEVIFQNALSKSIFGIVLSIVIAIIVIAATYFTLDGINAALSGKGKDKDQEQMLSALDVRINEQLKLGQAVYEKLNDVIKINKSYMEKTAGAMFANSGDREETEEALELKKAVDEINAHTLQSAKIIVKYQMKNSTELKDTLDLILEQLSETGGGRGTTG